MSKREISEAAGTNETKIRIMPGRATLIRKGKRATRLAFFIAGFGLACWAPLIPFVQKRLNVDSATLGGLGAVVGMPVAGALSGRIGSRTVIICGALGLATALPLLSIASSPLLLASFLLLFGMSLGGIDVASNVHGNAVQKIARRPLMSGFHALYSIGGLAGASGMTIALASGLNAYMAAGIASAIILSCIALALPALLPTREKGAHALLALPKGTVVVLGLLALIVFLAEGAVLDWSALLLSQIKKIDVKIAGTGYTVFAFAMMLSRFLGGWAITTFSERSILVGGLIFTALGIVLTAFALDFPVILCGLAVAGLAAGNIVPILFTLAGRQTAMPVSLAIAATSILGYLGVLIGPASIGYLAHFIGLTMAFYALAGLVIVSLIFIPVISKLLKY